MSMYLAAHTFLQQTGAELRYEEFSERVWIRASFMGDGSRLFDDRAINELRHKMVLDTKGIDPGRDNLYQAALNIAYRNSYNEVRDYFTSLEHGGRRYVGAWLLEALGAEDTPINRNTIKRFMVAAVARVFEPGARANLMPIFQGSQRCGKTPLLRILAREPHLFTDTPILHLDAQRRQEALRGKHFVEVAEMDGWRAARVEQLKALISATHDYARRVWGTHSVDQPRQCIFAGTTNDPTPLRDATGNFRFPILRVGMIDLDLIERHIDQIWAHAVALYERGYSLELPHKLAASLARVQLDQLEDDPWVDALASIKATAVLKGTQRVTYASVFAHLGIPVGRASQAEARRAADAMVRNGWGRPAVCKVDGKAVRCFTKSVKEEEER